MENQDVNNGLLSYCGLTKRFLSEAGCIVTALRDVTFIVEAGQFVTVVGATGCGKTTLLNITAGLIEPDEGVFALGRDIDPREDVSCVFQHYTLLPWRNILENVMFGLEIKHVARKERLAIANELLVKVGLDGFQRSYPYELSGGMRQRAAIAQALAIKPKLLLMDEPFGALDEETRRSLQKMIINLQRQGNITVLFVTHNIDEALMMGDKVVVFSESPGRVLREIEVDIPRPRDRKDERFTELFVEIRSLLAGETDLQMMSE